MKKQVEKVEEKVEEAYPHKSLQKIEDERFSFLGFYRKHNSLKIIVTILCLALIVVSCIVIPSVLDKKEGVSKALRNGITFGGTILAVVILAVYSYVTRRLTNNKMKAYFRDFYLNVNEYVFESKGYEKVELQEPGKINLEQFTDCHLYKDVLEIGSRGFTEFVYKDIPMAVVDCAGNVKGEKRMYPVFVGKYLFAKANYKSDDQIVVYLKGNERALPPTNLEGLKKVVEEVKLDVYSNNKNWKKTLTPEVMKLIESIKTNKVLVDLAISIYGGRVFVLMGYDDPLMILPLQNQFDSKPIEQYKADLAKVCKLVEELNK